MKRNHVGRYLVAVALGAAAIPAALVTATAAAPRYRIEWAACPGTTTAQCGTLRVPLDWAKPHGSTIDVAVARRPADDPTRRIGTLYFNPGGPGDGGVKYVIAANTFFSATLRARFDIVSVDPRGIAGSTPLRCGVPALTPDTTFFPRTQRQFVQLRARNAAVARSCLRTSGAQVRHMDTVSVARDHEALRIALGVRKVSWLGLSYGTQLGIDYAGLFPEHTRAMVLDAALEHSAPEVSQTADAIQTVESAFNRFARWCDTTTDCALHGQDVGAVFDRLVVRANRHPIPVDGALRPVTGDDILIGMPNLLVLKDPNVIGGELSWPVASQALAGAITGQAGAFALPPFQGPTDSFFGQVANACGDYVLHIRNWADMQQRIAMGRLLAPHLQGASENWKLIMCIGRPVAVANPPRALDVAGVPAMIVHATHDPSVSYKWAYGLADQIRDSVLLTRRGDGTPRTTGRRAPVRRWTHTWSIQQLRRARSAPPEIGSTVGTTAELAASPIRAVTRQGSTSRSPRSTTSRTSRVPRLWSTNPCCAWTWARRIGTCSSASGLRRRGCPPGARSGSRCRTCSRSGCGHGVRMRDYPKQVTR